MKSQTPLPNPRSSREAESLVKFNVGKRWLAFAALTCAILWASGSLQRGVQFFQGKPPAPVVDFQVYYVAGTIARGEDDRRIYSYRETVDPNNPDKKIVVNPQLDIPDPDSTFARVVKNTSEAKLGQYLYPPFFALLISPLTRLPFQIAAQIWYVLTYIFLILSVFLTVKIIYKNLLTAVLTTGFIVLLAEFAFPMQDLLWAGNVWALILFLCAAGIYLLKINRPIASALFIALAVFIKLTPVIIVPLLIMRRQWKWLAAFVAWSVLLFALSVWQLGWQNHQEFLTKIMPAMSNGIAERNNRSMLSVFQFAELGKIPTADDIRNGATVLPETLNTLFKVPVVLMFLGVLYYSWRVNKTAANLVAEIYLLLLLSLIISPVSWRHGYILALPPLVFIWLHPLTQKWSVGALSLLTAATVFVFSIAPDYALSAVNFFPLQMLLISIMPIGVLTSMFLLLKTLRGYGDALHDDIALPARSE